MNTSLWFPLDKKMLLRAILCLCMVLTLVGCKKTLFNEVTEKEANEMLAILQNSGIDVEKLPGKKEFVKLVVEESQMADAINILKSMGYPKEKFLDICDVFEKNSMISSPMEERVRYVCAIQQGLSETLSQLDGVISARVHVVMPEVESGDEEGKPSSASVFIKYSSDVNLQASVPQIKLLVNNSIKGLDYGNISVALFPAEDPMTKSVSLPGGAQGSFPAGASNRMIISIVAAVVGLLGCLGIIGWLLLRGRK